MVMQSNPSISQELRYQAIQVIPVIAKESLLDWLKRTGRLKSREIETFEVPKELEELEDIIEAEIYQVEEEE